jgi:hypothetical protein
MVSPSGLCVQDSSSKPTRCWQQFYVKTAQILMVWCMRSITLLLLSCMKVMSLELANIVPESFQCWWKCYRNSRHRFCIMVCPVFRQIIVCLSIAVVRSCWSQWVVIVACHCSSSWRWRVWHFVSDSHKVNTALIVFLPSNYCCIDFSAIS